MDARKLSIVSALAASTCCLPPLLLLGLTLLGVGTAGLAGTSTFLGSLKWYLFPLAIAGLVFSYLLYFRERRRCATGSCPMVNKKFTQIMLIVSTVVITGFLIWSVYPYVLGTDMALTASAPARSGSLAVFEVEGMTCGGCEIGVREAVQLVEGVDSAAVSFIEETAVVWFDENRTSPYYMLEAIGKVGYEARLIETKRGG